MDIDELLEILVHTVAGSITPVLAGDLLAAFDRYKGGTSAAVTAAKTAQEAAAAESVTP